jgi:hypothetical protein
MRTDLNTLFKQNLIAAKDETPPVVSVEIALIVTPQMRRSARRRNLFQKIKKPLQDV